MSESLPVLSLWEPWCTLVREGIKQIETRSWKAPDKFIGQRIALHSTKKRPSIWWARWGEPPKNRTSQPWHDVLEKYCHIDEANDGWFAHTWCGPLGAIVATARLAECMPIYADRDHDHAVAWVRDIQDARTPADVGLWIFGRHWTPTHIEDQRPYGDYSPGRWAWILADVEPVNPPVPFRGGQGFSRRWTPE